MADTYRGTISKMILSAVSMFEEQELEKRNTFPEIDTSEEFNADASAADRAILFKIIIITIFATVLIGCLCLIVECCCCQRVRVQARTRGVEVTARDMIV